LSDKERIAMAIGALKASNDSSDIAIADTIEKFPINSDEAIKKLSIAIIGKPIEECDDFEIGELKGRLESKLALTIDQRPGKLKDFEAELDKLLNRYDKVLEVDTIRAVFDELSAARAEQENTASNVEHS